jgi:hypothetical protein
VQADLYNGFTNTTTTIAAKGGIGINSSTVDSSQIQGGIPNTSTTQPGFYHAHYRGQPGLGLNLFLALEESVATGTCSHNYQGQTTVFHNGMVGSAVM